jgi:hypothetical protein
MVGDASKDATGGVSSVLSTVVSPVKFERIYIFPPE